VQEASTLADYLTPKMLRLSTLHWGSRYLFDFVAADEDMTWESSA